MKFYLRMLLLLMVAVLTLSVFVACDDGEDVTLPPDDVDDVIEGFFPDVEKNDYGMDLNIWAAMWGDDLYTMDEDRNSGSPMDEAVFARQGRVEKYLGIDIVCVSYPDAKWNNYNTYIQTAVQNMDGTLDIALPHVHGCVSTLISDNLVQDLGELDGIDLSSDYWNMEFMNDLELNGNYFLGYGDFIISRTYCISFNKDILARYESALDKSIYDTVKDYEWTLDKLHDIANLVYIDATGDGKSSDDTVGIRGRTWYHASGFLHAANIPMFEQDASGMYKVALNQPQYFEKADNVITKLRELRDSKGAFFSFTSDSAEPMTKGTSLLYISSTDELEGYLGYDLDFGVLPFPMYDKDQKDVGYRSLQWAGYITVPSYVKNPQMVGEALEMLSFYSEPVRITYYEKLLGKQVADMPDDVAMLDFVWDGLCCDVAQAYVDATATDTKGLIYTVGELIDPNATQNLASYVNGKEASMNSMFRKFLQSID